MNLRTLIFTMVLAGLVLTSPAAWAQQQPAPELLKAKKFFESAGIPGDKWIEGETMSPYVAPASHFNATMLYYPGTEELRSDEVRVTFMGSTFYPNESQSGMSIFVQLGNGDDFVFDLGIGSLRNYNAFSIPLNSIDHVFFTHLHMDHMSDLAYFLMFQGFMGGWHPLHIYGPSGSEPQYGIAHMVKHMLEMTAWHRDSLIRHPPTRKVAGYEPEAPADTAGAENETRVIRIPTRTAPRDIARPRGTRIAVAGLRPGTAQYGQRLTFPKRACRSHDALLESPKSRRPIPCPSAREAVQFAVSRETL